MSWYTGSAEVDQQNMWTYYGNGENIEIVAGGNPVVLLLKKYDLVIFNMKIVDAGTYECRATSTGNSVILGTTILSLSKQGSFISLV